MKALTVVAAATILAVGLVAAAFVLRTVDSETLAVATTTTVRPGLGYRVIQGECDVQSRPDSSFSTYTYTGTIVNRTNETHSYLVVVSFSTSDLPNTTFTAGRVLVLNVAPGEYGEVLVESDPHRKFYFRPICHEVKVTVDP